MARLIQKIPLIKKPDLLNDVLEETEQLIKGAETGMKAHEDRGYESYRLNIIMENAILEIAPIFLHGEKIIDLAV